MTTRCNLLIDGYELAAEHVKAVIRHSRGVQTLVVRKTGDMRLYGADRVNASDRPHVVGAYNKSVRIEELEEDLIDRARELSLHN